MSALEPPVPATAGPAFDAAMSDRTESVAGTSSIKSSKRSWRYALGLLLLGMTVFLWTASNFLASTIFADNTFSKPYFVTYVNTSFFVVQLIPVLGLRAYRHPEDVRAWWDAARLRIKRRGYGVVGQDDGVMPGSPRSTRRRQSMSASQELLLGDRLSSDDHSYKESQQTMAALPPLELAEIARLSLEFCFLWYLANYFVAACLEYTSVASATILTSTSSVFTLIVGAKFGVERLTWRKALAVAACLTGVVMISVTDVSGTNNDDEHRGDFPEKTPLESTIGDLMALISAVLYGLYAVFLKKRIDDESRVSMPTFFGLVGLFNVILLWPGFIILHYTGIETFELPPTSHVLIVILCNSAASLISDLFWAYAVLLTSPIVVTVGLSMTIPLSLIGQVVLNNQTAPLWYWLGAAIVVLSFVFVSAGEEKLDRGSEASVDGRPD